MRLLNTLTLQLHNFIDSDVPPYAILSHRWLEDEVIFEDVHESTILTGRGRHKAGAAKIKSFCQLALEHNLEYAWVDTCCIDKSSSAELSEAINSMFLWYREAKFCIVYLADVTKNKDDVQSTYQSFRASEWFRRGWTLQELLAPTDIYFYDRTWTPIGTKKSLQPQIEETTGITKWDFLYFEMYPRQSTFFPYKPSIARRISWAAHRITKRPEDMAYCLLGICQINMPLLYGERGTKAFQRLQIEILRSNDDETILAWDRKTVGQKGRDDVGVLAESPADFTSAGDIDNMFGNTKFVCEDKPPFEIIPRGLRVSANLWFSVGEQDGGKYLPLRCHRGHSPIFLKLVDNADQDPMALLQQSYIRHSNFRHRMLSEMTLESLRDEPMEEGPEEIVYLVGESVDKEASLRIAMEVSRMIQNTAPSGLPRLP